MQNHGNLGEIHRDGRNQQSTQTPEISISFGKKIEAKYPTKAGLEEPAFHTIITIRFLIQYNTKRFCFNL